MKDFKDAYNLLYYDLVSNRLETILIPSEDENCAKDGGKIRVTQSKNPKWYSDLCDMYPRLDQSIRKKKKRTIVKRRDILGFLDKLRNGKPIKSKYLWYLEQVAQSIINDQNISKEDIQFFEQFGELPLPFNDEF